MIIWADRTVIYNFMDIHLLSSKTRANEMYADSDNINTHDTSDRYNLFEGIMKEMTFSDIDTENELVISARTIDTYCSYRLDQINGCLKKHDVMEIPDQWKVREMFANETQREKYNKMWTMRN